MKCYATFTKLDKVTYFSNISGQLSGVLSFEYVSLYISSCIRWIIIIVHVYNIFLVGWLIPTGRLHSNDRAWSMMYYFEKPSGILKLDRSWAEPVTASNTGLPSESRTVRTSFIPSRCAFFLHLVIFLKKVETSHRLNIAVTGNLSRDSQIFSQPRHPIVDSWIILKSATDTLIPLEKLRLKLFYLLSR